MTQTTQVPVTGPASEFDFEQAEVGHIDRTAMIRAVIELGERYLYEYRRARANIRLDLQAGESDLVILENNHTNIMEAAQ